MTFKLLTQEEFEVLSTKARIDYLRRAMAAIEELKSQIQGQVIRDTAEHIRQIASRKDDKT